MKMDMANFTIQQIRPYIQQQSVEYEKKKFQEFLQKQQGINELLNEKTNNLGFWPSLTQTGLYSHRKARSLKFQILEGEGLYYPCSENNGADQLCCYCTADLRLCFRIFRLLVFLCGGSFTLLKHAYATVIHFQV